MFRSAASTTSSRVPASAQSAWRPIQRIPIRTVQLGRITPTASSPQPPAQHQRPSLRPTTPKSPSSLSPTQRLVNQAQNTGYTLVAVIGSGILLTALYFTSQDLLVSQDAWNVYSKSIPLVLGSRNVMRALGDSSQVPVKVQPGEGQLGERGSRRLGFNIMEDGEGGKRMHVRYFVTGEKRDGVVNVTAVKPAASSATAKPDSQAPAESQAAVSVAAAADKSSSADAGPDVTVDNWRFWESTKWKIQVITVDLPSRRIVVLDTRAKSKSGGGRKGRRSGWFGLGKDKQQTSQDSD
eukprot:jgi/Hompol1/1262/HPOL_005547-RA